MSKLKTDLTNAFVSTPRYGQLLSLLVTISMVIFTYYLVYMTGGIKYVYSHTMYIAIIFAGYSFGIYGGIAVGVIGGLILGPIMPLDVSTGEMQDTFNWIYRLLSFSFIGGLVGYLTVSMKHKTERIINLLTQDSETNIPLFKMLATTKKQLISDNDSMIMVRILNKQDIVDSLNQDFYYGALSEIYKLFTENAEGNGQMYLVDYTRLVIVLDNHLLKQTINRLKSFSLDSLYVQDIPLHLEVVFGVLLHIDSDDLSKTLDNVNEAAYASIKNQQDFMVYENLEHNLQHDVLLVGEFAEAIKHNDLRVVLHPIYDIRTDEIALFEALSRWEHPEFGNIAPDRFIPLITNTQLIILLTQNVISKLKTIKTQIQPVLPNIKLSFNICPRCIYNTASLSYIIDQVKDDCFELELTEETFLENTEIVKEAFNKLDKSSIKINIDDFGKGYSSLSYISEFAFHKVKIDKLFTQDLTKNKKHQEVISFVIQLAHSLGKEVVAEGVEDKETLDMLKLLGCDYAQGYYYTKPLEVDDVLQYISK